MPIITSAISGIGKTYKPAQNAVSMAFLGTPAGLRIWQDDSSSIWFMDMCCDAARRTPVGVATVQEHAFESPHGTGAWNYSLLHISCNIWCVQHKPMPVL